MCKQICSQKVRYKKAFRPLTRKQFFFFLLLSRRILDLSPRFSLSKSPPKVGESIAQSIYNERKKSFLSSLDSILRQIGCLNRRDITKQIDETVTNCLASERESFLTQITAIINHDANKTQNAFDEMCKKLVDIANRQQNQEQSIRSQMSLIKNKSKLEYFCDAPLTNLLANQLSLLSQMRCEIGIVKASLLSIISTFLSTLAQNRQLLKSAVLKAINETSLRNEQLEIQLRTQQRNAQEREQKIAMMEQKIAELTDQVMFLKQQRASNARVAQLERQIAEKNKQLEEQKQNADATILQLEQELEDKTNFLEEQRRASNAQIFQLEQRLDTHLVKGGKGGAVQDQEYEELEAQIAERDKIIEQQKRNSNAQISQLENLLESQRQKTLSLTNQLKSKDSELEQLKLSLSNAETQLTQHSDTITMLEAERTMSQGPMTLAELEDLKQDSAEKDDEIKHLKSQLETMSGFSSELDSLRSSYLKKSQEVDELKRTTEIAQKKAIELENKNKEMLQEYKALELQMSHGMNQQSSLQSDIDHALMICQIRKKKIKRLKSENATLRTEISAFKKQIEEQDKEIKEFRASAEDNSLETTYLKQQLSVAQTDTDRNNLMINTMNEKLSNAMSIIQEKERVIDEMMEMDQQKAAEIESLNMQLTKQQKDADKIKSKLDYINKTQQIEEQQNQIKSQEEQIKLLSSSLTQTKANLRSLELTYKDEKSKNIDLVSKMKEQQKTILQNEAEIHRLLDLTSELTTQKATIIEQNDSSIIQFKDQTDQSKKELEKLKSKNKKMMQSLTDTLEKLNAKNLENEQLMADNLQIKAENNDLTQQIKNSLQPLQNENEKLRNKTAKLTSNKQQLMEEYAKLEKLYNDLKMKSQSSITLLEKKVSDLTHQLNKSKSDYDSNVASLEQHFESLNLKLKGANSAYEESNALFQELAQIFVANSIENLLQKATEKVNECQQLKRDLDEKQKRIDKLTKTLQEKDKKNDSISNEASQLSMTIDQMNEELITNKEEKQRLLDKIDQLKFKLKNEKEEHETTKICFDELRDDLAGFKDIVEFNSLAHLKKKLTKIIEINNKVTENTTQSTNTIRQLESQISKYKKENNDQLAIIKEQNQQISQMTKSTRDLKAEILRQSKDTNQTSFELQNELQKTKDQLKNIQTSITKLHEVVAFTSNDDVYIAVASAIHQKDQLINELRHQQRKLEVTNTDAQLKLDSKSQKIEDQLNEITKLRNEQFELKRDKTHLEKDSENLTKAFNKMKSELDQKNLFISKIQTQISHVVQFSTFDELPAALFGFKEEFDLQKQKNQMLKENLSLLQKQHSDLEKSSEEMRKQFIKLQQESISMKSQLKRKAILDSQIYGVANINDLPKHFTQIMQTLEDTEQRLEHMGDTCKDLTRKLQQTEQALFDANTSNEELTVKNTKLTNDLKSTNDKNANLEETVESMTFQIQEYEDRLNRLENQNTDFKERTSDIEKMMSQIGELIDFEDPQSLVQVITDLKKENDETGSALIATQRQLEELFEEMPDLILTKKITAPLSNAIKRDISEYLNELTADARAYKTNVKSIVDQARNNGFHGKEIGGALEFIHQTMDNAKINQEENIKLKEKIKLMEANIKTNDEGLKGEYESQIESLQNVLNDTQDQVEKLNQVKTSLIRLKAGEDNINEDILKEVLTDEELDKIGLHLP